MKGGGGRGAARPAPFVRCASPQPPAPRTLSSPRGKGDYPEPPDSIKPPESKDSAIFFIVFNISDPRPPPPPPPSSDGRLPLRHKGTAIPSETAAGRKQNRSESQPTGTKARGRAGAGKGGRWWRGGERKGIKEGKKKQQRKRNKTKKPRGLQPAARSTKRGRGAGPERPPPAVGPRGGGLRRSRRGTYRRKAAAGGRGARGSLKRRGDRSDAPSGDGPTAFFPRPESRAQPGDAAFGTHLPTAAHPHDWVGCRRALAHPTVWGRGEREAGRGRGNASGARGMLGVVVPSCGGLRRV